MPFQYAWLPFLSLVRTFVGGELPGQLRVTALWSLAECWKEKGGAMKRAQWTQQNVAVELGMFNASVNISYPDRLGYRRLQVQFYLL